MGGEEGEGGAQRTVWRVNEWKKTAPRRTGV